MLARPLWIPSLAVLLAIGSGTILAAQEPDQLPLDFLSNTTPTLQSDSAAHAIQAITQSKMNNSSTVKSAATANAGLPGIDSLVNFTGQYNTFGYDPSGNPQTTWQYSMVGNPPELGGTTTVPAPVIPVSLDLRNYDGSPRFVNGRRLFSPAVPYLGITLRSPIFKNASYSSSSQPTQYNDAIQRAEFADRATADWHTLLKPEVRQPRVMTLIRGTYYFALNADGSCCAYVLIDEGAFVNALFPATYPIDNTTVIGAAELAGDMTSKDMTSFLFPNAYLYSGSPNNCCVLGFHSFDYEPGTAANGNRIRAYVMNYSSWISPGLFGPSFQDVTALSHELSETFNDPFVGFDGVHNVTPWWLSPNHNCQDTMEDGDVIEGLSNATTLITTNGYTYHPQNEALLPWFEFQSPSTALDGAYSYPDETVLTQPSPVENPHCM